MEPFFFSSFLVWWKESFTEEQNVFLWSEEHLKQEIHDRNVKPRMTAE